MKKSVQIRVKGIVQGVGFRPFVYRIACEHKLKGNVRNDTEGVLIFACGPEKEVDAFVSDIKQKHPPLSLIQEVIVEPMGDFSRKDFVIEKSIVLEKRSAFIAPDSAVCDECLEEFFTPDDRRHHYPFITCINCGPRFSIVNDIPYDRENTTMASFAMCANCVSEYSDHLNRRFHTQPNACAVCGPKISLYKNDRTFISDEIDYVANETVRLLMSGKIFAIKSVGGFLLAADASLDSALGILRQRKGRPLKPFALMAGSIEIIKELAHVSVAEETLLLSKERPVVLLKTKGSPLSGLVAPSLSYLGIMLPYMPFQHLLFSLNKDMVLVMTSGNITDEPIIYKDDEAFDKLSEIADYFVVYNRDIRAQTDDSVLFVENEKPHFIRRARGYVPAPFISSAVKKHILATGGDLKNTFALAKDDIIVVSQHIGDIASLSGNELYRKSIAHFEKVYDFAPGIVTSDMHPGYFTTQFADELEADGLERIRVQHHHAHIAGVLEEHNLNEKVIGIAFDGTGYGTDGTLWGSEFLIADKKSFTRAGHFSYFPLPGGEAAIKDVWKIGISMLYRAFGAGFPVMERSAETEAVIEIIEKNINCPVTCSIGRVFDGISGILGISRTISTEAEAAMLLEEAALRGSKYHTNKFFQIPFNNMDDRIIVSTDELTAYVVSLVKKGQSVDTIAFAFHGAISVAAVRTAGLLRERYGIDRVALSGGVFQNRLLFRLVNEGLRNKGFTVYTHQNVPCNDGCIAYGQIAVAKELI